jgi:hypothetical protein
VKHLLGVRALSEGHLGEAITKRPTATVRKALEIERTSEQQEALLPPLTHSDNLNLNLAKGHGFPNPADLGLNPHSPRT